VAEKQPLAPASSAPSRPGAAWCVVASTAGAPPRPRAPNDGGCLLHPSFIHERSSIWGYTLVSIRNMSSFCDPVLPIHPPLCLSSLIHCYRSCPCSVSYCCKTICFSVLYSSCLLQFILGYFILLMNHQVTSIDVHLSLVVMFFLRQSA
jgi:hypothetical protein